MWPSEPTLNLPALSALGSAADASAYAVSSDHLCAVSQGWDETSLRPEARPIVAKTAGRRWTRAALSAKREREGIFFWKVQSYVSVTSTVAWELL